MALETATEALTIWTRAVVLAHPSMAAAITDGSTPARLDMLPLDFNIPMRAVGYTFINLNNANVTGSDPLYARYELRVVGIDGNGIKDPAGALELQKWIFQAFQHRGGNSILDTNAGGFIAQCRQLSELDYVAQNDKGQKMYHHGYRFEVIVY